MIVKSFRASSAVRALKKVREEMGQEAIVLKTRQIRLKTGGTAVEITACIEKPTVGVASQVLAGTRAAGMATDEAVAVATEKVTVPPTRNRVQEFVPERVVTDRKEAAQLLGNDLLDEPEDSVAAPEGQATKQKAPAASKDARKAASSQSVRAEQRTGMVKQAAAKVAAALKAKPAAPAETVTKESKSTAVETPAATQAETAQATEAKTESAPVATTDPVRAEALTEEAKAVETAADPTNGAKRNLNGTDTPSEKRLNVDDVDHRTIASAISTRLMEMMTDRIAGLEKRLEKLQSDGVQTTVRPRDERQAAIDHVVDTLRTADVPEAFVRSFAKELAAASEDDEKVDVLSTAHKLLTARLAEMMVPHFDFVAGDRLVFVGPAGAGKSSVMGKLAFRLAIKEKMKVNLSTLDTQKMAAHEEIASYADVLGVPLEDVPSDNDAADRRTRRSGWMDVEDATETESGEGSEKEPVRFIDTPALPGDEEGFATLSTRVAAVKPTNCFAVFSSLMRSTDILAMSERMAALSPSHVILTMADLTPCCGGLIAAAQGLSTKVAFVCNSPAGRGSVMTPDPDAVARTLLNTGVDLG